MAFLSPCSCRHDELQMSPWPGEIPGALEGGGGGSRAIPRGCHIEDLTGQRGYKVRHVQKKLNVTPEVCQEVLTESVGFTEEVCALRGAEIPSKHGPLP